MQNGLFLLSLDSRDGVHLKVGSRTHGRVVSLTDEEAVKLGHKLMSLGSGGATRGYERFPEVQS